MVEKSKNTITTEGFTFFLLQTLVLNPSRHKNVASTNFTQIASNFFRESGQYTQRLFLFPIGWKLFSRIFLTFMQQKHLETQWELGPTGLPFSLGFFL